MIRLLTVISLALVFVVPAFAAKADSVDLKYRSYRNWTIQLPSEKWFAVKDGIKIPHAGGDGFAVSLEGNDLRCDTCLLYTSPSPRDKRQSRMPSSA